MYFSIDPDVLKSLHNLQYNVRLIKYVTYVSHSLKQTTPHLDINLTTITASLRQIKTHPAFYFDTKQM